MVGEASCRDENVPRIFGVNLFSIMFADNLFAEAVDVDAVDSAVVGTNLTGVPVNQILDVVGESDVERHHEDVLALFREASSAGGKPKSLPASSGPTHTSDGGVGRVVGDVFRALAQAERPSLLGDVFGLIEPSK
ncbi:hypothetical protein SAMN05443639_111108 [Stigmatella erecta]|uniref:Uncharacterized protein n=1 Tax=Stigmatella erecta TaxID=83460 RepID=A0A1I0KKP8_9BACT|nr:hypothetical protein SAMN05443639_111108 [Stigmatella erecta]